MATQVQLRRGTSAENDAFTGALGEVTVDTTNNTLRVHDGSTAGGFPVAPSSTTASKDLDNLSNTGKANISAQGTYDSGATYNAGTVGKAIQGKANVDMDNLTAAGKNIGLWCDNASNCIVELPQDINLTLSAGTLTLKAGSKVYVPNGFEQDGTTPKFDVVTFAADKTFTNTSDGQYLVFYNSLNSSIVSGTFAQVSSGTPDSTTWGFFYDTVANRIDFYNPAGTRNDRFFALPLCIVTVSNGAISSIDQIFNGFGFIGDTVFVLPGVKAVVPDGRNADGTLKNIISTIDTVKTGNTYAGTWFYNVHNKYIAVAYYTQYFEQETMPSVNCSWYQPSTNKMYHVHNGAASLSYEVKIFNATRASGVYTSLTPYMPFRAVDYSDTEFIGYQAMPSNNFISMTWAASGTAYTMAADGYLIGRRNSDAAGQYMFVYKNDVTHVLYGAWTQGNGQGLAFCVPVSKGDTIIINYSAAVSGYLELMTANGVK